ncbi:uncharacterized protein [Gossypium hirsutum]|uniref:Tf2-1-like SH3-like domain-containing protein n=1 Tax=Gossypium hirsutum TaxID=3635 RepID=A0A1U8PVF3_GOSHI|nr:uncharacterized protein LOC107963048 [Gossypium hirsutum]
MAPYKALYRRKCYTPLCWTKLGKRKVLGLDLVQETHSFLEGISIEESSEVWVDGQVEPRFIGPYQILRKTGPVAYQFELPLKLDRIHDIFHVSVLIQYRSDPSHIIPIEEIEVRLDLTFKKELAQILDQEVKVLRRKLVRLVKSRLGIGGLYW